MSFADDRPKPPRKRVRAEAAEPGDRPRRRKPDPDDDDVPYAVNEPVGEALPEEQVPESVVKPRDDEMKLLNRDDAPKKPKVVWSAEVLAFLGQSETLAAAGLLTLIALGFGGFVRMCRAFNPAAAG